MVRVLLVGNGAREHVIAETLKKSPQNPEIVAYMKANNPGIADLSEEVGLGKYDDFESLKAFAQKTKPDFAFIGPDDPIAMGVVDQLESVGVKSCSPKQSLGRLESSKSFTRELLTKYDIPGNPKYKIFKPGASHDEMRDFLDSIPGFVVKPDGLTGGKGVKVQGEHLETVNDALKYCEECLADHDSVIIEEKLDGEEFSLQCITDGETVILTPPVQDHKRAFIDDTGPNTGGMGSYSDADHNLPFLDQRDVDDAMKITRLVARALKEETGDYFKGVMYGGWICTSEGVKLIEYNARFGDPEAMNTLPIFKGDFVKVCQAIIDKTLDKVDIEFEKKATVCKYVVPNGYPDNPVGGEKIEVDNPDENVKMYYASVDRKEDGLYLSSSRAVGFVGIADTLAEAEQIAESNIRKVSGKVFHRPDIGTAKLLQKRIDHMKRVRPED